MLLPICDPHPFRLHFFVKACHMIYLNFKGLRNANFLGTQKRDESEILVKSRNIYYKETDYIDFKVLLDLLSQLFHVCFPFQ